MNNTIPKIILTTIGLVLLQIVFMQYDLVLFNYAFCYVYPMLLLMLPLKMNSMLLMVIGFFLGLTIDAFFSSPGIHSAATVCLAFVRPTIVRVFTPQGGYDNSTLIMITSMGTRWYTIYALIGLFIHHFMVSLLHYYNLSYFFTSFFEALFSAVYSFIIILLIQLLFAKAAKK